MILESLIREMFINFPSFRKIWNDATQNKNYNLIRYGSNYISRVSTKKTLSHPASVLGSKFTDGKKTGFFGSAFSVLYIDVHKTSGKGCLIIKLFILVPETQVFKHTGALFTI